MNKRSINYLLKENINIDLEKLTSEQIIQLCRDRIKEHSFFKFRQGSHKGLCDVQSANVFVKVFDALNEKQKEVFKGKLNFYGFSFLVNKCWGLVK